MMNRSYHPLETTAQQARDRARLHDLGRQAFLSGWPYQTGRTMPDAWRQGWIDAEETMNDCQATVIKPEQS